MRSAGLRKTIHKYHTLGAREQSARTWPPYNPTNAKGLPTKAAMTVRGGVLPAEQPGSTPATRRGQAHENLADSLRRRRVVPMGAKLTANIIS